MSLPTEIAQQQINLNQYPEKFRQPFLEALRDKKLVLIGIGGKVPSNLDVIYSQLELTQYVIPFLNANPSINALDLALNQFDDEGAEALARITTLSTLNLTSNQIRDTGAKALAKNTTLKTLYVSRTGIDVAGLRALACNTTLETLDISRCYIGDRDVKALARNTALRTLYASRNEIGDAGAQALARNTTLETLDVSRNPIGNTGKNALQAANQYREDICDRQKLAFLSVMTLTKDQTLNAQKQQTLLFKFREGSNNNRLVDGLVSQILSYNKLKPLNVTF